MAIYSILRVFILLPVVGIKAGVDAFDERGFLGLKESIFEVIDNGVFTHHDMHITINNGNKEN